MGLLEDAIRDHLDLKRKHGASHEELVREEADALGPARRDQLPAEQPAAEPAVDEPAAEDDEAALPHEPASHEPPPAEPGPAPREAVDFLEEAPEPEELGSERKPPRDLDFE